MTTKIVCPHCEQRIEAPDDVLGTTVACPTCNGAFTAIAIKAPSALSDIPSHPREAIVSQLVEAAGILAASPSVPFSRLGICIGWAAVLLGSLLVIGGIGLTFAVAIDDRDFKPAGLLIFAVPGLCWFWFGRRLLGRGERFVMPFFIFLWCNMALGLLFSYASTQVRGSDRQIFGIVSLSFILGSLVFLLFHTLIVRDLQRQRAAAMGAPEARD